MKRVDLLSPILREAELPYEEFQYPIKKLIRLPLPSEFPTTPLQDILSARKSERNYGAINEECLSTLLWHSARVISAHPPSNPIRWQHRPVASAGGKHPIDLLIMREFEEQYELLLYNPFAHGLVLLDIPGKLGLKEFVAEIKRIVPLGAATVIWFGAQFERTLARYENGESLVWRDVGGIIAVLSLVATTLSLNCCPVGITGEPFLSGLLDSGKKVVGVGGILVGSRDFTPKI